MFTTLLARNTRGSGFMVGARLSVADLFAFHVICNWYKPVIRGKLGFPELDKIGFPALEAYIKHISTTPAIAEYISTRQAPTTWLPNPWGKAMGFLEPLSSPTGLAGLVAASPKVENELPSNESPLPARLLNAVQVSARVAPALLAVAAALVVTARISRTS